MENKPETAPEGLSEKKDAAVPGKPKRTFFYSAVMFLYRILAKVIFFLKIEGAENIPKDRNCVLMGNHISNFDPLTLAICVRDREIHFMGKKELFANSFIKWIFEHLHAFPVDRGNIDMGAVRTAMNVLKSGDTLGIFPEGTRSRKGHMLPLLGGASLLALKSGKEVVPVYIDGPYRLFRRVTVTIGKPVPMADILAGRINKEACDLLTARIENEFAVLSGGKSLPPADSEK